ncbi:hypothetical protein AwMethylo_00650 [Methylobacterium sp.]|nr:hypothetical protein AwMethylo_00650 [Methylobacterium sp.]
MSFGFRTAPGRRPTASRTRDRGSGSRRSGFPTSRFRSPLAPQDGPARRNEQGEPKREGRWSETDLRGGGSSTNGCSGKTQGDGTERMPGRNAWLEPVGMPVQNAFSRRAVIASGFVSPDERPVSNSPL